MNKFINEYLLEAKNTCSLLDQKTIKNIVVTLKNIKKNNGRIFFLGVGGGAANSTHAVNDFRKICGIESYSPSDNVSELTARINDEGWSSSYKEWLIVSNLSKKDALFMASRSGRQEKTRA